MHSCQTFNPVLFLRTMKCNQQVLENVMTLSRKNVLSVVLLTP